MGKSIVSNLLELMPQTITMRAYLGANTYGEATFSTSVSSFRARVEAKPKIARTVTGEVLEVATVVWFASTKAWTSKDKITLPDGSTPKILLVATVPDENGYHHNRLELGY